MNKNARLIALKIAAIQEEYTAKEIQEAITLLTNAGYSTALLKFLAREGMRENTSRTRKNGENNPAGVSSFVASIEQQDPEKFLLLRDVERLLRTGRVLPTLNDIRRFGSRLDKSFNAGKSRNEAIVKLMPLLGTRTADEIGALARDNFAILTIEPDDYQRLASYILTGKIDDHTSTTDTNNSVSGT